MQDCRGGTSAQPPLPSRRRERDFIRPKKIPSGWIQLQLYNNTTHSGSNRDPPISGSSISLARCQIKRTFPVLKTETCLDSEGFNGYPIVT